MESIRPRTYRRQGVRRYRFTRDAFERMAEAGVLPPDARVELIDGELIEMSPQGSRHATALHLLVGALRSGMPEEVHLRIQAPLDLGDRNVPEPDVAVVAGTIRDYAAAHPRNALLVVEVSDTTYDFDVDIKRALYARSGIPEYWIVNLSERQVEVYTEPSGSAYNARRTFGADASFAPIFASSVRLNAADVLP